MITEAATTQDLIATFSNARPLGEVSFEEGCIVLDAIAMFDRRAAGGKLGTWLKYSVRTGNTARFVPTTDAWDDYYTHRLAWEKLAEDVSCWTSRQRDSATLEIGAAFTAWVVIDRATRVTWVECSPVQNQRPIHPRSLHEACEFPSSSRGTVSAHVFLRMGEPWHEVLDSVLEAYHEAKDLLDKLEGCDHNWDQDVGAARKQLHEEAVTVAATDLHVTDGAVGIRTSQLSEPLHIRTLTVSGAGSVGIDLDDGAAK
jgi:hypothetical protein